MASMVAACLGPSLREEKDILINAEGVAVVGVETESIREVLNVDDELGETVVEVALADDASVSLDGFI